MRKKEVMTKKGRKVKGRRREEKTKKESGKNKKNGKKREKERKERGRKKEERKGKMDNYISTKKGATNCGKTGKNPETCKAGKAREDRNPARPGLGKKAYKPKHRKILSLAMVTRRRPFSSDKGKITSQINY
ncbi:MAG: hypothetical protein ACTSP4_07675 [Candidatus Hodarchaeales archaeon]